MVFQELFACPICDKSEQARTFFSTPYDAPEMLSFFQQLSNGRIESALFAGSTFEVKYCTACDFYWHRFVLSPQYLVKLYGEWADAAQSRRKQEAKSIDKRCHIVLVLHRLLSAINAKPGARVLDFGGGWSTFALPAKALGCKATLLEGCAERVQHARSQGIDVVGSIDELPDGGFDLIVLSQVLEHIPQPKLVLNQLKKKLSPGGGIFLSTPCVDPKETVISEGAFQPLEHLNGFTPKSLRAVVNACGLEAQAFPKRYARMNFRDMWKAFVGNSKETRQGKNPLPEYTDILAR